jgi:hypothetical protein
LRKWLAEMVMAAALALVGVSLIGHLLIAKALIGRRILVEATDHFFLCFYECHFQEIYDHRQLLVAFRYLNETT